MRSNWTDERIVRFIGNILRAGVILAACIVAAGGILYLVRHGQEPAGQHVFEGEPANLRSPSGVVADTLALRGRGIIQLGLLLMIAVPIARVTFSVWAFAQE